MLLGGTDGMTIDNRDRRRATQRAAGFGGGVGARAATRALPSADPFFGAVAPIPSNGDEAEGTPGSFSVPS